MTSDELIELKIKLLQNPHDDASKELFNGALAKLSDSEKQQLIAEFDFLDHFWTETETAQVEPSANLRANFYQMLQKEQTARARSETKTTEHPMNWFASLLQLLKPAAQFAMVCVVFLAGMGAQSVMTTADGSSVKQLKSQVEELNSMVALSLLQQPSATERLSGVSYSTRLTHLPETLVKTLIGLLTHDKSTTVRLAIINSLLDYQDFYQIEEALLEALQTQNSPLVELQLIELITFRGSDKILNDLQALINNRQLSDEVLEILAQQDQQDRI